LAGGLALWLTAARRAAAGEAAAALATAADRQVAGQLADALAAARRAEGLLAAAGDPADLRERVAERLADLDLVARLARIRAGHPDSDDHLATRHLAEGQYAAALREAGLDIDAVGVDAAAAWIDDRPALKPYLVAALDDWAVPRRRAKPDDPAGPARILAVARAVDPGPWRDRARDAVGRADRDALKAVAASADPRRERVSTLNLVGEALVLAGENQAAIALLRRAHAEYPGDFSVAYLLGHWLWRHGEPSTTEEMVRVLAIAVSHAPDRANAWLLSARGLLDAGRLDDALAACDRALRLRPDGGPIFFVRAGVVARRGDPDGSRADLARARDALGKRVATDPDDAYAWYTLGRAHTLLGEADEALAADLQAVRDRYHAWPHHNLGVALRHRGRLDEALPWLEKAVALNPNSAWIRHTLAGVRAEHGDVAEAVAELRTAITCEPWDLRAYLRLAALLTGQGKSADGLAVMEQAVERAREMLRYRPLDGRAHLTLAAYHRRTGDRDAALHHYRRGADLDPMNYDAYVQLADEQHYLGLLDEALATDRRWARAATENAVQRLNDLAFHLAEKGEPLAEAHQALRRALALNPASDIATLTLAEVYRAEGRFAESLEAYRQGHDLHQKKARQRWKTADWVKEAEWMVELDRLLPEVLTGTVKPAGPAEACENARVCAYKGLFADAARFYADAFAAEPSLAGKLQDDHRNCYLAARAAARAAATAGPDDAARAKHRRQALEWLRAELVFWQEQAKSDKPADRLAVRRKLNHWRTHDDLLPVRNAKAIAALPKAEGTDCERLWAEVAELLDRLKPPPVTD